MIAPVTMAEDGGGELAPVAPVADKLASVAASVADQLASGVGSENGAALG
jgi:hypothetical protein